MRPLSWRGTVEGFYGQPWSHEARLAHLAFCAEVGFNTYVYAPKDDPYHRARWREPYPAEELGRLAELTATARELGIRLVAAIAPGLSMRFHADAEHAALAAKAGQLYDAGVRAFGLLFDDVPPELAEPGDIARFGAGTAGCGAAHGETCRRFTEDFLAARGIGDPLLVCPTDYAGTEPSAYRKALAATAPADILIAWTGADIVVGAVTGREIDLAAASYRRPLLLWDNFPVNDFDPARLFLGPLTGRVARGDEAALYGIIANPMSQEAASRIALGTVAEWARDPDGYREEAAAGSAGVPGLAPLARVCGAWPPSADQDPELTAATSAALEGAPDAEDIVIGRLTELARCCATATGPGALIAELRPWLAGATATAEAGLAAVRLLRAGRAGAPATELDVLRRGTRRALDGAEDHYANVLRPIVPPFVRAVLDRTAPAEHGDHAGRPVAALVTGSAPTPGDRALAEYLAERGCTVRRAQRLDSADDAAVVFVTNTAEPAAIDAVARVAVPLLTWRWTAALGLATGQRTVFSEGRLQVVAPADPLAAGRDAVLPVLRGPAWLSVADVTAPSARVVAKADGAAAVFRYAPGDRLADGTIAPATRIGLFLGPEGPARWLLTEHGQALLDAALDLALA